MRGFKPVAQAKGDTKDTKGKGKHPITDYASGGSTRRRLEALGLKDGGPVRGPGNGISDSIETEVPEGSYIMPADSTEQIGEESLAGMGKQVPVNLSDGEYQLPPDQVHAIGLEALDQMRDETHVPAAEQAQGLGFHPGMQEGAPKVDREEPPLFFADGGRVFSNVEQDELGRDNNPRRRVAPRSNPMYVDSSGTATQAMPSQSRALVPAGPATGTSLATVPQPSQASASTAQPRPDFYTNDRGETAKGFPPSSSRAVVPTGSATGTSQTTTAQPSQASSTTAQPSARPEPNYRARAETMARAKADTAAYEAHRAAQDERFTRAAEQPAKSPNRGFAGRAAGAARNLANTRRGRMGSLAAIPALINAYDPDSTARYAERFGVSEPTGDGSLGDIAKFAALRAGGFASDVGSAMTFGLADGLYRDKNGVNTDALATGSGAVAGGVAGNRVGNLVGRGFDTAARLASRGRYSGNYAQRALGGLGEVGGVAGGVAGAQMLVDNAQPESAGTTNANTPNRPADPVTPNTPAAEQAADQTTEVVGPQRDTYASGIARPDMVDGVPTFTNAHLEGFDPNTVNTMSSEAMSSASPSTTARLSQARADAVARGEPVPGVGGFQPSGSRVTVVPDSGRTERERNRLIAAASTPHPGAQNGQLTSAQISALRGAMNDERSDATTRSNNESTNSANILQTGIREAGADRRDAARNLIDERRVALAESAQGIQNRSADRMERLYQAHESAQTPEERTAIAEQIRVLNGDSQSPRYAVAAGGQILGPNQQLITQPAQVFNQQTGEFVQQPQQSAQPSANHIAALRKNPNQAAQFDAIYGPGASARILGGQ